MIIKNIEVEKFRSISGNSFYLGKKIYEIKGKSKNNLALSCISK